MVRQSHWTGNAVFVRLVFADYNGGARTAQRRQAENQKCGVVSKRSSDLFGRDRLCQAAIMGKAEFSNIAKRGGDDKNTTSISGMPDRYALLRHLIWIKSSLERV